MRLELLICDEVDSTNDEARRLLKAGRAPGFAVAARLQTAGRGRLQRVWIAPPGNLSVTIVLPWQPGRADAGTVALVSGLAVQRAIAGVVGPCASVAVKWPNDVLIDGAKVSGTLIEADDASICIGIGVNILHKPPGVPYPTTCLRDVVAATMPMEELARAVIEQWTPLWVLWQAQGF